MNSSEVRQQFLDFFRSKAHAIVPSSPVVPHDDPTLMFTNAGMNQFKDVFLGTGSRAYNRAADTQKCIRAGGKHNDLDDVGQDTYHHTFFEMLGNWSFGDYFKKEAIAWAWELLTGVWKIDPERLHATYFEGDASEGLEPDTEARDLWRKILPADRVHPGNKKDNFWEMGDTGPCGPCSEIHIDLTPDRSGGGLVNAGDARVMEIWNLVFIQYNRGTDGKLTPLPAKHVDTGMGFERICAVLTGMSRGQLGRVSNYDTDVFTPIFEAIQKRTNAPKYTGLLPGDDKRTGAAHEQVMVDTTYRVIADHIRTLVFAITDGAIPDREGRGYVLRRILRRAVRYGWQYLNVHEPFLCDLVEPLVGHMEGAFPELRKGHGGRNVQHVEDVIREEEVSFGRTLERGIELFEYSVAKSFVDAMCSDHGWRRGPIGTPFEIPTAKVDMGPNDWSFHFRDNADKSQSVTLERLDANSIAKHTSQNICISGADAFRLHDTYGFPIDLTELMAEERGLSVNVSEYEQLMDEARTKARSAQKRIHQSIGEAIDRKSLFVGYEHLDVESAIVLKVVTGEELSTSTLELLAGEQGALVLDNTSFYAEQGGQVGDRGRLVAANGSWEFRVEDTQKVGDAYFHIGMCVRGSVRASNKSLGFHVPPTGTVRLPEPDDDPVSVASAIVDPQWRIPTMRNHTATHVLNWALRQQLGDGVQQKGSLVDPEKTRFDFSYNKPVGDDEIRLIEELVVRRIGEDLTVYTKEVEQQAARRINTLRAVFGEKYPDVVRVVSIGADIDAMLANPADSKWMEYSVEFCGGTHVKKTSEIGHFAIVSEEGVAKGVRRIVGLSGDKARSAIALGEALLAEARELGGAAGRAADGAELQSRFSDLTRRVGEAQIRIVDRRAIQAALGDVQKAIKEHSKQAAAESGDAVMQRTQSLLAEAQAVSGVTVVVGEVPSAGADALRGAVDWIRQKTESSAVLLATAAEGKVTLIAGMSRDAVARGLKAGDLIKEITPHVGGKGGGRPDMAQGGGTSSDGIPKALAAAREWIASRLIG